MSENTGVRWNGKGGTGSHPRVPGQSHAEFRAWLAIDRERAMAEYKEKRTDLIANTTRLKQLRLDREASDKAAARAKKRAPKRSPD